MTVLILLTSAVAIALFIYLMIALLKPEMFP